MPIIVLEFDRKTKQIALVVHAVGIFTSEQNEQATLPGRYLPRPRLGVPLSVH
jgi:hypothetical protein